MSIIVKVCVLLALGAAATLFLRYVGLSAGWALFWAFVITTVTYDRVENSQDDLDWD